MVPAVALAGERSVAMSAPSPTRAEVLARYRHLRAISKQHHSKILDFVSSSTLLQQARRIGISDGRRLILDSMSEFDLLSDLVVYTAPMGRSRALDRYARNLPPEAGSDEALCNPYRSSGERRRSDGHPAAASASCWPRENGRTVRR